MSGYDDQQPRPDPPLLRLDQLLAEPDEPQRYRVDRLWPVGGRIVLNAAWKAGKTTTVGNLVRSLVDGGPFLDTYDVTVTGRPVVVLDDELDLRTIRRWYRDQDIKHTDQVYVVPLRGQVASLDLLNPATLQRWADRFRAVDAGTLVLDCLSPVLAAAGLDENRAGEVRRFLDAFDTLLARSGADEGSVIHHMGHAGERGRGASALRDWPDAEWSLIREKPDSHGDEPNPSAPRYFRAYGRDVDEPEQRLDYDPTTRRLTIGGASRRAEKADRHIARVVAAVEASPGLTTNAVVNALQAGGVPLQQARLARSRAVELGAIRVDPGPNRSRLHYPTGTSGGHGRS